MHQLYPVLALETLCIVRLYGHLVDIILKGAVHEALLRITQNVHLMENSNVQTVMGMPFYAHVSDLFW